MPTNSGLTGRELIALLHLNCGSDLDSIVLVNDEPVYDVIPRLPVDWELSGAFLVFTRTGFPWIALAYTAWSFLT
jgi:hypothetical protein